jgi:hypothetical protein
MLACPVQSNRKKRRAILAALAGTILVLGATAGTDHSLAFVIRKSRQQFQARACPIDVFSRLPELTWRRIPSKVQKAFRLQLADKLSGRTGPEQIDLVPRHSGLIDFSGRSSRNGMDVVIPRDQKRKAVSADETRRSCDQDLHVL